MYDFRISYALSVTLKSWKRTSDTKTRHFSKKSNHEQHDNATGQNFHEIYFGIHRNMMKTIANLHHSS